MSDSQAEQIRIEAPARLHMGFMDLHGGLGRSFGSLGLCLDSLSTSLTIEQADTPEVSGPSSQRVQRYLEKLQDHFSLDDSLKVEINSAIPEHMGLGSGTQLSLAIGLAVTQMYGISTSIEDIASLLGRGARSGIGIGAFKYGGFLVDGGRDETTRVPPVIARMPFPEDWRVLLILDHDSLGVHGTEEVEAFKALPKMTDETVDHLCRIVLMQVLPALAEENCEAFGQGITEIQNCVGDHFSHAQGGRYASAAVAEVLEWGREREGVNGIGQSSWGPTGFLIFSNETQAHQTQSEARQTFSHLDKLDYLVSRARNQMADVFISQTDLCNRVNVQNF